MRRNVLTLLNTQRGHDALHTALHTVYTRFTRGATTQPQSCPLDSQTIYLFRAPPPLPVIVPATTPTAPQVGGTREIILSRPSSDTSFSVSRLASSIRSCPPTPQVTSHSYLIHTMYKSFLQQQVMLQLIRPIIQFEFTSE